MSANEAPSRKPLNYWARVEQIHSSTGQLPTEQDADHKAYLATAHQHDGDQALALSDLPQLNPLLKLRSLIHAGEVERAVDLAKSMAQTEQGPLEVTELLLERSRLAGYKSDWDGAIRLSSMALELGATPVTQMSLLQTRALAHFEKGDIGQAGLDLRSIEGLRKILPNAPSALMSRYLQIRVTARDQSPEVARRELRQLWGEFSQQIAIQNMDTLFGLIRCEIDLSRLELRDHAKWALAELRVAERLGNKLLVAMAQVDLAIARKTLDSASQLSAIKGFERAERFLEHVSKAEVPDTSAQAARAFVEEKIQVEPTSQDEEKALTLYIQESKILIQLSPFSVYLLGEVPQLSSAISLLGNGPVGKEKFFHSLWGEQKYVPSLHDPLLWSLTYRIRKSFELEVRIGEGEVSLRGALVLA